EHQPRCLHRLSRLRHGVPGREQQSGRRQDRGHPRSRDALAAHRSVLRGLARGARDRISARAVHAMRERPLRGVCPGHATVHDSEGINDMVYNRCVGTRFCSNNCPYKVRRFNFFAYTASDPRPRESWNPEVTVRGRGVMEKCTYCVQRTRTAMIAADRDNRRVQDGEVKTACQQACPTEAIVFGDQNDAASAVARRKASPLDYAMLGALNTRPRTTYEALIRNPNPALASNGTPRSARSGEATLPAAGGRETGDA